MLKKAIKAAVLFAGTAAFLLYTRGPDVVHYLYKPLSPTELYHTQRCAVFSGGL